MTSERTELGCAGHFICSRECEFRRHTQVRHYRISTIGNLFYKRDGERQTLGAGDDSFFETMVFELSDNLAVGSEGCGCREVIGWTEVDGARYATAGEAQAGHEAMVAKWASEPAGACQRMLEEIQA